MVEKDPLRPVLREWKAPLPSPKMDASVLAAYRSRHRPSLRSRLWTARVSIPVPALAALLVILAVIWQFRPQSPQSQPASSPAEGYRTRIEAAGFQPLPDGATRVIRAQADKPEGVRQ